MRDSREPHPEPPIPAPDAPGRVLAIDYGERRIGLAVSDETRTVASPAGFVARRAGKRPPVAELVRRAEALEVSAFVMGLPLDDQGEETERAAEVRRVASELERRTALPVRLVDERYTTAAALRAVREMGGSTRGRKGDVDALAATVLLQHALSLGVWRA
jgi:putative Holliday junction resolvase